MLVSARCAAKGAAPSWKCRAQLVGFGHLPARHPHTRRYPILSVPPLLAFQGTVEAGYLLACISMMALQKALEGSGSAGRAGLSNHFKISLKIKNALGGMRFWFPPAVVQGLRRAVAVGFSFLGIPVCLILLVSSHCSGIYQEGGVSSCDSKTTRVVSS